MKLYRLLKQNLLHSNFSLIGFGFLVSFFVFAALVVLRNNCKGPYCGFNDDNSINQPSYHPSYHEDIEYLHRYNLMTEAALKDWQNRLASGNANCTIEYMNANELPQDHPCVIDLIRQRFLYAPSTSNMPYNLDYPSAIVKDESQERQPTLVLSLLNNKTGGFYVECGALDGEILSNSLYLEHTMKWTGLLVEPQPGPFQRLLTRNRKSWASPVCLSLKPYPTMSELTVKGEGVKIHDKPIGWIQFLPTNMNNSSQNSDSKVPVQCFPVYSLLLAVERTQLDFYSLDIDGFELEVLRTVPFRKLDIKTFSIEVGPMGFVENQYPDFIKFMETKGYTKMLDAGGSPTPGVPLDAIFMKTGPPSY